jgi:hypothetical protein
LDVPWIYYHAVVRFGYAVDILSCRGHVVDILDDVSVIVPWSGLGMPWICYHTVVMPVVMPWIYYHVVDMPWIYYHSVDILDEVPVIIP